MTDMLFSMTRGGAADQGDRLTVHREDDISGGNGLTRRFVHQLVHGYP